MPTYKDQRIRIKRPDSIYAEYFTPRPSSELRIIYHSSVTASIGFFYGIGRAIQAGKSRFKYSILFGLGSGLATVLHNILNEVFTGMSIRKLGQDQYWITNTAAAVLNCAVVCGVLCLHKPSYRKLLVGQQLTGSICVMNLFFDLNAQVRRKELLKQ